ncbi:hypothetical protein C8R45DRAFT_945846 [Mycena sanguinolenta]|nr:hypothetical protein C8R45DRAFT_945846 [Mycena sanguinolenta]
MLSAANIDMFATGHYYGCGYQLSVISDPDHPLPFNCHWLPLSMRVVNQLFGAHIPSFAPLPMGFGSRGPRTIPNCPQFCVAFVAENPHRFFLVLSPAVSLDKPSTRNFSALGAAHNRFRQRYIGSHVHRIIVQGIMRAVSLPGSGPRSRTVEGRKLAPNTILVLDIDSIVNERRDMVTTPVYTRSELSRSLEHGSPIWSSPRLTSVLDLDRAARVDGGACKARRGLALCGVDLLAPGGIMSPAKSGEEVM